MKYGPEIHKTIIGALRAGVTYTAAAGEAGISERSLRSWYRKGLAGDPVYVELARDMDAAKAYVERNMTQVIYNAALAGDWRAAQLYLERRVKEWRPKNDLNIEADLERILDVIESALGEKQAEQIFALLASGASPGETESAQIHAHEVN